MNKILILILLFFAQNFFGQNNFKITYGVQFQGNFLSESQKKNVELAANFNGIEDFMSKYKFELTHNSAKSIYKAIPYLPLDEESISEITAKIFIDYEKQFFFNKGDSLITINQELYGRKYNVITDKLYSDWVLLNESKTINGFLCLKAISKIRNVDIEAWYSPSIPVSLGPNEYRGLPGLILELNRGKLKYLAIKIDFESTEPIIFPPGETINYKEFITIFEKSNGMFKNDR